MKRIYLEITEPACNRMRIYVIAVTTDLLSDWVLIDLN
jgi:hypothetical protein